MAPNVDVRLVVPGDRGRVAASLAAAFADDPVFEYLVPGVDPAERERRIRPFFAVEVQMRARVAGAWTTPAGEGAALWAPPDRWRTGALDGLRMAWPILRAAGPRSMASMAALSAVEKVHPREPHWYLAVLGTDPGHQGRGIGAALLEPVLERCDQEGLPAYLESSKESNVPYYERFGFRTTDDITLARGGPTLYLMWREPEGAR